jgi:3-oxosteroid 1-dehydrogenase
LSAPAWNETVDVVVIGAGLAGLAAAVAAAHRKWQVAVLEKHAKLGGGSSYSWGFLWVAPNHLASEGDDSEAEIRSYMEYLSGGQAESARMDAFIRGAPTALKFFADRGVRFRLVSGVPDHYYGIGPGAKAKGRMVECELFDAGKLGSWQDRVLAPPAPYRLTGEEMVSWGGMNNSANWPGDVLAARTASDQRGLGVGLVSHFLAALLRQGVSPRLETQATRLVTDAGRVVGVVTSGGQRIRARKGVVIATGGYESNSHLVDMFEGLPRWHSMYPSHITGDGLLLGQEVGAAVRFLRANLALFLGYHIPSDPPFFRQAGLIEMCSPHTLVVNQAGKRFADESYFPAVIPAVLHFDPVEHQFTNLPCYLIFDDQYAQRYVASVAGGRLPASISQAASLKELAAVLGIDPAGLGATVERFNGFVREGRDADFRRGETAWTLAKESGRSGARSLGAVEKPPFCGVELQPSAISSAGLAADAAGRVLHVRGDPIPGLYASGNAAARTEYGAGYQAGHSLTSGITFSYLAVQDMAKAA